LNIERDSGMVRVSPDHLLECGRRIDRPDADAVLIARNGPDQPVVDRGGTALRRGRRGDDGMLELTLTPGEKEAMLRSTWIIKTDEGAPRLTSCFVLSGTN